MTFNVVLKQPDACSSAELSAFRDLVVLGDEVEPQGLEKRIRNAKLLAFGYLGKKLIGVAAIKSQAQEYRKRVFQKARIPELSIAHVFELGWVFVLPAHRGNGHSGALVRQLLDAMGAENIYSTSKTVNIAMHRTLAKLGFASAGLTWRSRRGDYDLAIYLRPAPQQLAAAEKTLGSDPNRKAVCSVS